MDSVDRKLIAEAEKGLLFTPEPFSQIAAAVGISTQEAIKRLKRLQEEGIIRRFGISLKPNDVGFNANAMVAWRVPANRVEEVGAYFASYKDISHVYERETVLGKWEYNLYTVIHAKERQTVEALVKLLSGVVGIDSYVIIFSTKNLKTQQKKEIKQC